LSSTARPSARCVGSFSDHQLGAARTLAVAVEADIRALGSSLRQLNTLPSVQGLDLDFIGQRVRAAFEAESTSTPNTGTTIELLLPRAAGDRVSRAKSSPASAAAHGRRAPHRA
jgi:hypothetical protein